MIYHCHIHKVVKKGLCDELSTLQGKDTSFLLQTDNCSAEDNESYPTLVLMQPNEEETSSYPAWTSSLWRLQVTHLAPMHKWRALACYNNLTLT